MARRSAAKKKPPPDPLSELADAVAAAAAAAATSPHEAEASSAAGGPAPGSLAHYLYTGSYLVTFGVVFPALLIARSISSNNPAAVGAANGAETATAQAKNSKKSAAL